MVTLGVAFHRDAAGWKACPDPSEIAFFDLAGHAGEIADNPIRDNGAERCIATPQE